jgi:hypothetical protein
VGVAVGQTPPSSGWRWALQTCRSRRTLRRTVGIALVVGTVLTLINQLDVFVRGEATVFTGVKVVLNFCVPFIVSNLGVLAAKKGER